MGYPHAVRDGPVDRDVDSDMLDLQKSTLEHRGTSLIRNTPP